MKKNSLPDPVVPLTWWGIAARSLVAIALLLGSNIVAGALIKFVVPTTLSHLQQLLAVTGFYLAVFLMVCGGVALWLKYVERRRFSMTGMFLHRRMASGVAVGTFLSVCVVVAMRLVALALFPEAPREAIDESQLGEATWLTFTIFILGRAYLLQGIPEELLFRGWLLRLLPEKPKTSLAFTTAVFTVIHLVSSGGQQNALDRILYLMLPLGFGLLAGVLVLETENFWQAVGIHGGFHVGTVAAAFLVPSHMVSVDWVLIGLGYIAVAALLSGIGSRRRKARKQRFLL